MANEYQAELDRIHQNIADTYSVLRDAGAETPSNPTTENLAETAASIAAVLYNTAQSLSDTQKSQARSNIGALAETELESAVTDALAQAKESGDFDGAPGKDGTSVTVSSVSESEEDGGTNVVTFSDGKTMNVKNGSRGSDGAPGKDGSPGADGAPGPAGRGVQSMTYNASTNKWTVAYTDGSTGTVDGPAIKAVLYASQTLTDAQKEQARTNVEAAPVIAYGTKDVSSGATSSYPEGTLYVVID